MSPNSPLKRSSRFVDAGQDITFFLDFSGQRGSKPGDKVEVVGTRFEFGSPAYTDFEGYDRLDSDGNPVWEVTLDYNLIGVLNVTTAADNEPDVEEFRFMATDREGRRHYQDIEIVPTWVDTRPFAEVTDVQYDVETGRVEITGTGFGSIDGNDFKAYRAYFTNEAGEEQYLPEETSGEITSDTSIVIDVPEDKRLELAGLFSGGSEGNYSLVMKYGFFRGSQQDGTITSDVDVTYPEVVLNPDSNYGDNWIIITPNVDTVTEGDAVTLNVEVKNMTSELTHINFFKVGDDMDDLSFDNGDPYGEFELNGEYTKTVKITPLRDDDTEGTEVWKFDAVGLKGGLGGVRVGGGDPFSFSVYDYATPDLAVFRITQDYTSADEETMTDVFTITGENLLEGKDYTFDIIGGERIILNSSNPNYVFTPLNGLINVDGDQTVPISVYRGNKTDTFTFYDTNNQLVEVGRSAEFDFTIIDADGSGNPAPSPTPSPTPTPTPSPVVEVAPSPTPSPEPTPEPVVEVTPEPVVEVVPEPVVEITPEPVVEVAPEFIWNAPSNSKAANLNNSQIELAVDPDFIEAGDGRTKGTGGEDFITGSKGNDFLIGKSGDDYLRGGSGNDRIRAGNGNDFIIDGAGDDIIKDGNGDDFIVLGKGEDTVRLNSGNNFILGFVQDEDTLKANGNIEWMTTEQGLFGTYDNGTVTLV